MTSFEVYCLPFGAGFGHDAFVGSFETASEAQAAKRRDAHERVGPAQVKACLCSYVIRPPGIIFDDTLEKSLYRLRGETPTEAQEKLWREERQRRAERYAAVDQS